MDSPKIRRREQGSTRTDDPFVIPLVLDTLICFKSKTCLIIGHGQIACRCWICSSTRACSSKDFKIGNENKTAPSLTQMKFNLFGESWMNFKYPLVSNLSITASFCSSIGCLFQFQIFDLESQQGAS